MKKLEKALLALILTSALFMTGITSAQQNRNQNRNSNANNGNTNANQNRNTNANRDSNANNGNVNSNMDDNMNMNMNMNMNGNTNGNMNSNINANSTPTPTPTPPGTVSYQNTNVTTTSQTSQTPLDAEFANMAAQGGEAEIQMANLALQKSQNKNVQKFARQMVKDHTKSGNKLEKLATKKSLTLTKTPNADQMQMMSQLQQASAAEFDMMYLRMAGVESHQAMETLFTNQASNGTDAELKDFASDTLPTVQKHLAMAQTMMNDGMSMSGNTNGNMNDNSNRNSNSNSNRNDNR